MKIYVVRGKLKLKDKQACLSWIYRIKIQFKSFLNVMSQYDDPSVLVNNAGITSGAFFHKMTAKQWNDVISINMTSIFNITQPIYQEMLKNKFGRIINISSVNAQKGQVGQVNYGVSKAGTHGFTKALSIEGARSNITVNTISPGYIDTQMTESIREDIKEQINKTVPLKRFGKSNEIAKAVSYLISDDAEYITGSNLSINGGLYLG